MLVPSESTPQDASSLHSDARSKTGVLTPDTVGSSESRSNARKRKRDDVPGDNGVEDLLSESFLVKPYPSSSYDKSYTLKPIAILSRSDLPLSWLDRSRPASSATSLPESRFFEGSIKILDLEQRMSSIPSVLIARLDDTKSIYAIEHDSRSSYVFIKLASPVDLNKIYSVAVVSRSTTSRPGSRAGSVSTRGGDDVVQDQRSQFDAPKFSKKKKLDIEAIQSMVRRKSATGASENNPIVIQNPLLAAVAPGLAAETPSESYIPASQEVQEVQPEPTPEEVLENIRSQYLENLYLSKASTAYFAKGPLSRARATYQLDIDSTFDMKALIDFLKSLVLPATTLDKKYKDGVTEAVSRIESGGGSDTGPGKAPRKKRARKEIKLAKSGLYTNEEALLQQWWENYDNSLEVPGTSREAITRSRIAQLRIRETQLQMIVILETLQLEKMAPPPETGLSGDIIMAEAKTELKGTSSVQKTKGKKPQDLPALINILVDRLAIWQSISAEEGKGAIKSVEEVDDSEKPVGITDKHAADILKDFCVEVIVPFYAAKLPSMCDTICRKLGGPKVIPSRPPMKKAATVANPASRPGAATKRAPPRVSEAPTLERMMTEERAASRLGSRGLSRAASLMRSATMPGLKREKSETPSLSRIPSMDSISQGASRNGVQNSKKMREVDLSFPSLVKPAIQKANVDLAKREAIEALRKPNRLLQGKNSMEELKERQAAAAASQCRKAKKPVRNALFDVKSQGQGVQIQATPRVGRHQDMMSQPEPQLPSMSNYGGGHGHNFEPEPPMIPPSSVSKVPSSGSRLVGGGREGMSEVLKATPLKRRPEPSMTDMDTPTRQPSLSRSTYGQSISATPARAPNFSQSMNSHSQAAPILDTVADTPARPSSRPSSSRQLFAEHLSRGRSGAPPSPSPPKCQSTMKDFMPPPMSSRKENIFETPQKSKKTILITPELNSKPMKPLDFGRGNSVAVPESPAATVPEVVMQQAPPSSNPDAIYQALNWDDDYEL